MLHIREFNQRYTAGRSSREAGSPVSRAAAPLSDTNVKYQHPHFSSNTSPSAIAWNRTMAGAVVRSVKAQHPLGRSENRHGSVIGGSKTTYPVGLLKTKVYGRPVFRYSMLRVISVPATTFARSTDSAR